MSGDQEFDPESVEGEYVYVAAANHVEARIRSGRIPPGARLAGERELAAELHVALGTARRVIKELRDRGLVRTLPAKGTFVLPADQWPDEGQRLQRLARYAQRLRYACRYRCELRKGPKVAGSGTPRQVL